MVKQGKTLTGEKDEKTRAKTLKDDKIGNEQSIESNISKSHHNSSKASVNRSARAIKQTLKRIKFALSHGNLKRKLTQHSMTASSRKELKYMRIINYIRRNFQKITSLSELYRRKNLSLFHHYLIGDLATDSLIGTEKDFAQRISKALKRIEGKNKNIVSKNIINLSNKDDLERENTVFYKNYLKTYNLLHKCWIPIANRILLIRKLLRRTLKVIPPNSPIKIFYDFFAFCMIVFTLLFLPLHNIFWAHQNKNFYPLLVIVIFFCSEIAMSFNTAYIKNGIIYFERRKIFMYSLNIHKAFDVLFLYFSLETFMTNNLIEKEYYEESDHITNSQLTNVLIIYKVIRMSEISIYIEDFLLNLNEKASIILRMIKLLAFNFICAHLIACCWISISFYDKRDDTVVNWASDFEIETTSWFQIYIYGLYWAVTTMLTVGYGDITGTTNSEIFFSIMAMIFSCCLYGYTMNTVGVILRDYNNQERYLKFNFYIKYKI